jgi:hypothetical protein
MEWKIWSSKLQLIIYHNYKHAMRFDNILSPAGMWASYGRYVALMLLVKTVILKLVTEID